jgi:hypothetical protein
VSGVAPGTFLVTATSNEPSDPHQPDIVIQRDGSGGFEVFLRAEQSCRGEGRIYTLTAAATDLADNVTTVTATCVVSSGGHGHPGDDHDHHDHDDHDDRGR